MRSPSISVGDGKSKHLGVDLYTYFFSYVIIEYLVWLVSVLEKPRYVILFNLDYWFGLVVAAEANLFLRGYGNIILWIFP